MIQMNFVTWACRMGSSFQIFQACFCDFLWSEGKHIYGPVMIELDFCENKLVLSFAILIM